MVFTEFIAKIGIHYRSMDALQLIVGFFNRVSGILEAYPETILDASCDEFSICRVWVTL